jgi:flagellar motor switch protein FliG
MATSSLHKATVLLLSLSREQAAQLLDRLEPEQVAAVTAEMRSLREVDSVEQEAVVREFAAASATCLGRRRPAGVAPFQFLNNVGSDDLLHLIADEHPQTVALILSYLPPRQAAAVLAGLPPEGQLSVVCRIAAMDQPSPEVIRDVEQGLRNRLCTADGQPADNRGVASVVKMLNVMEPKAERRLLGELTEAAPELMREIRRVMFGVDVADCQQQSVAEAAC